MKNRSFQDTIKSFCFRLLFIAVGLAAFNARSETVYYALDNVVLDDGNEMTGLFSWVYDVDDFENGTGLFLSLEIPWTTHNHTNLNSAFDIGKSIEITLEGSVHDDGVDITLVLENPLAPTTSSPMNLARSKYEIGGNGFHTGKFQSGSITVTNLTLSITPSSPGSTTISWEPDIPGYVLQETQTLSSNWVDSASGSTNPVVVPVTTPAMFYRLAKP